MEQLTITCPWCDAEIQVAGDAAQHRCQSCRRQIDLAAQFCYLRGRDAFASAMELAPRAGKKKLSKDLVAEQTESYLQAFTAIEEALQGELSQSERQLAIEMMADMARLFAGRLMTSPMEADYWAKLALQQNTRREVEALKAKLAQPASGSFIDIFRRWRWRIRFRQLARASARLEQQVVQLERSIDFVRVPKVH